jgi:uncharacterized protein YdbL (DUF1318 family)
MRFLVLRFLVVAGLLLLTACQTQQASLPPAPATPVVRTSQQLAVTNAVAKEMADEHSAAREGGRAAAVESLKDSERVAEDRQGYLRPLRPEPTDQVKAIVNQVNDDRRIVYQRLALEQRLALPIVERIAGDARTTGERPGRLVLDTSGQPVRQQ